MYSHNMRVVEYRSGHGTKAMTAVTALMLGVAVAWSSGSLAQAAHSTPATGSMAAAQASGFTAAQMDSVLAGDWRSSANRARDAARHPQATLQFFAVGPQQTVIEIAPGGGWYTELLAPLLRDKGHYVGAEAAPKDAEARRDDSALRRKFAADPAQYGHAAIVEFNPRAPVLGAPASADRVLTFRNVHNWVAADTAAAMFKAFFAVLRPGGVLGVVEHRANAGASLESMRESGYVSTSYVTQLATAAGFKLDASSEINANPRDTKNHPKGVWTLPPTYSLGEQDKAKYTAIGESDRMTLRFVKPGVAETASASR